MLVATAKQSDQLEVVNCLYCFGFGTDTYYLVNLTNDTALLDRGTLC